MVPDHRVHPGEALAAYVGGDRHLPDRGAIDAAVDSKPLNVMLTRGGAKLLDFNIASRVGDPVRTRSGTPASQAPDADLTRWDVSTLRRGRAPLRAPVRRSAPLPLGPAPRPSAPTCPLPQRALLHGAGDARRARRVADGAVVPGSRTGRTVGPRMYVRVVVIGEVVPEGLAAMPPGPALAAVLATLPVATVPNDDIVEVLLARSRQLAHAQAAVFEAMVEVMHRRPFAGPLEVRRGEVPELHAADEIRAALAWTRRAADRETDLAYTLVRHLPDVQRALAEGHIDRAKAWVFTQHLADLTPAQITLVCRSVLPHAGRLSTGQIGTRLKRLVLAIDPTYYQRRYRKAVRDRMLIGYLDADGAATISAKGLPAEDAAAALERIDALARATRAAGHPDTLDQLRADIALGLLDGTLHGLDRDQIIAALLPGHATDLAVPATPTPTPAASGPEPDPRTGPDDAADPEPVDDGSGGASCKAASPDRAGSDPANTDRAHTDAASSDGTSAEDTGADSPHPDSPASTTGTAGPVGIEIRAALSTLLGLDQQPGEIPGWGPVTAETARRTVHQQRRASWRWVVVDAHGHLFTDGATRARPADLPRHGARGGIVELQIPETTLTTLLHDSDSTGVWAPVIADIAAQHARHRDGTGLRALDAHPRDRFPRTALRRHVQIRDRTCTFPSCAAPARRCDQDHTLDHALGGTTTTDDLSPACPHDHTLKTEGRWQLRQPEPGHFLWISPLGRRYPVRPEPILPAPIRSMPREPDPTADEPADDRDEPLVLRRRGRAPPPEPVPEPATTEAVPDLDEPPPF